MTSACYPKHPEPTSRGAECAISMLTNTELAGLLGIYTLKICQRPRNSATSISCPLYWDLADSALLFRSQTEPAKVAPWLRCVSDAADFETTLTAHPGTVSCFFRTGGSLVECCSWAL